MVGVILNMIEEIIIKIYLDKFESMFFLKYNEIWERYFCFYVEIEKRRESLLING